MSRLWPTGTLRVPAGTCPGCAGDSHPGRTCQGRTSAEVTRALRKVPGAIYVRLDVRGDRP